MEKEIFAIRAKYRDKKISKEILKREHNGFFAEKPQLFEMLCSDDCNDSVLNKMMKCFKDVSSGKNSQHESSVILGQELAKTYIYPVVNKK